MGRSLVQSNPVKLRLPTALRVLEVTKIKTVPYVPLSHPFVERLIGTVRREFSTGLYSGQRQIWRRNYSISNITIMGMEPHAGLDGRPPEPPLRIRQGQVSQLMTSTPDEHSRPADPFVLVRRRTLRGRLPSGTSSRSIESPIDAQIDLCRRRPG